MSLPTAKDLLASESVKAIPCAGCGKPAECSIWGTKPGEETPVCYPCVGTWEQSAPRGFNAPDVYFAYTAKWLAWRRGERAA